MDRWFKGVVFVSVRSGYGSSVSEGKCEECVRENGRAMSENVY